MGEKGKMNMKRAKQWLALVCAFCVLWSFSGVLPLFAAEQTPAVRDFASYPAATAFRVENQQDLAMLASLVNGGKILKGYTFLQTADITLTGTFTPIGSNNSNATINSLKTVFQGTYDGQGHTISNLQVSASTKNGVGLFGACYQATLKNIGIESGNVLGYNRVGAIAGYADASTLTNCYNKAAVASAGGIDGAGGIVGVARESATMTGCFNLGTVTAAWGAAGICGWGQNNIALSTCYNGGMVQKSGSATGSGQALDAICRNANTANMNFSSSFYQAASCGTNSWGARAMATVDQAFAAYQLNYANGYDNRAFTLNNAGALAFSGASRSGITILTLEMLKAGVATGSQVLYLAGDSAYAIPEVFDSVPVLYALAGQTVYQPKDTLAIGEEDMTIKLFLEGSFHSAADVDSYAEDTIYTISSAEELSTMAMMVNKGYTFEGKKIYVIRDLDFKNFASWVPIGLLTASSGGVAAEGSAPFMGSFDGQFYHFKNIAFSTQGDYQGLFAYIEGGSVQNIVLDQGSVTGNGARLSALCSLLRNGTVRNIESHLSVVSSGTAGSLNLGLVSLAVNATLENALVYGVIGSASSESAQENGGITGYGFGNSTIKNCLSLATVYGSASQPIARNATLNGCYSLAETGGAETLSWAQIASKEAAWLLNTVSGSAVNSGLFGSNSFGPTLDPMQPVIRLEGTLIDKQGEQFGTLCTYYTKGTAVNFETQPGYAFQYASIGSTVLESSFPMPGKDLQVFAYYENLCYPIQYHLNGGAFVQEAPQSHKAGYETALPNGTTLQKDGFVFAGWYDNEALSGTPVTAVPGDLYRAGSYYAAWEAPVEIGSAAALCALAAGDLSGHYRLTADLDLTGLPFTPIGSPEQPFTGSFDGNGYRISGLALNSAGSYQGLFGYSTGVIRNVTLDASCSIAGSTYVGGIAGYSSGTVADCVSYAEIKNRAGTPDTYSIMTQNLCIWGTGSFSVTSRQPWMVARVEREQPDILGMQEGSEAWVDYLAANLTGYTMLYQYRYDKESTPLAFKTDKFQLVNSGTFWLSTTPEIMSKGWDGSNYRVCTWAVLRDKTTGALLCDFNTHLDVGGATARAEGAKLVKSRMMQILEQYPGIMIFSTGDYNTEEYTPAYNTLTSDGLADTRYLAAVSTNENTHSEDLTANWVNAASTKIDYIMTYQDNVEVEQFRVLDETVNNTRLSDHNGLIATFHAASGICFGGAVGWNAGTVQRVLTWNLLDEAREAGGVIGRNSGMADHLYYADEVAEGGIGSGNDAANAGMIGNYPFNEPSFSWALNQAAGRNAFSLQGDYPILSREEGSPVPVRLMVNGAAVYALSGSTVTLDTAGFTNPVCALNGVYFAGTVLTVPAEDGTVTITESVNCVTHDFGPWEPVDGITHRRVCSKNASHIETAPHRFGEATQVAATCYEGGYTARVCLDCGYVEKTNETAPLGHRFGAWQPFSETEHVWICQNDSSDREYAAHQFDAGTQAAATCTEGAKIVYTCLDCSYTETITLGPPLGHTWGPWVSVNATAHQRTCQRDASHTENAEHRFTGTAVAATCTTGAGTLYTCQDCGYSYFVEETEPLGHSFGAWQPLDESRHIAVCTRDASHTKTESHHFGAGQTVAPTCTEAGYTRFTCADCGYPFDTAVVPALGHRFGAWMVRTPATENAAGELVRTCTVCGAEETRVLPGAADPAVVAECSGVAQDRTVTVTVRLQNNPGVASLQLLLQYDKTQLTPLTDRFQQGDALGSLLFGSGLRAGADGSFKCTWIGAANDSTNGVLFTVTFQLADSANGNTAIGLQVVPGSALDANMAAITLYDRDAAVSLGDHQFVPVVTAPTCTEQGYTTYTCSECGYSYAAEVQPALGHQYQWDRTLHTFVCTRCGAQAAFPYGNGDVDGDGILAVKDVTALLQHLNGWSTPVDLDKADVSGNGQVSLFDAVLLLQILSA